MTLVSLLYISRSTMAPSDIDRELSDIVATAADFNAGLGLTGALLFTGTYFAQLLEGQDQSVDRLIAMIIRDTRHGQMLVIDRTVIDQRRFQDWRLVYVGPSLFVSRHVTRLLNSPSPAEHRRAVAWLTDLLWEFAAARD